MITKSLIVTLLISSTLTLPQHGFENLDIILKAVGVTSRPNEADKKPTTTPVPILKQINEHNEDGSYTYGYEAADGSFKVETRYPDGLVQGKYGYIDIDTGEVKVIEYGADMLGFQPVGDLPEGIVIPKPVFNNFTVEDSNQEVFDDQGNSINDPQVSEPHRARGSLQQRPPSEIRQQILSQNRGQELIQPITPTPKPRAQLRPTPASIPTSRFVLTPQKTQQPSPRPRIPIFHSDPYQTSFNHRQPIPTQPTPRAQRFPPARPKSIPAVPTRQTALPTRPTAPPTFPTRPTAPPTSRPTSPVRVHIPTRNPVRNEEPRSQNEPLRTPIRSRTRLPIRGESNSISNQEESSFRSRGAIRNRVRTPIRTPVSTSVDSDPISTLKALTADRNRGVPSTRSRGSSTSQISREPVASSRPSSSQSFLRDQNDDLPQFASFPVRNGNKNNLPSRSRTSELVGQPIAAVPPTAIPHRFRVVEQPESTTPPAPQVLPPRPRSLTRFRNPEVAAAIIPQSPVDFDALLKEFTGRSRIANTPATSFQGFQAVPAVPSQSNGASFSVNTGF